MIIHGECEKEIPKLKESSIDLMITSPPYNVDLGNNKKNKIGYDKHDDNMNHDDYIK
jgi:DNA modification methylase